MSSLLMFNRVFRLEIQSVMLVFSTGFVNYWLQNFYVTDGNIMYLTDASRFLISCVIQHYAPVVGWGGMEEQMHNVDYHPGP